MAAAWQGSSGCKCTKKGSGLKEEEHCCLEAMGLRWLWYYNWTYSLKIKFIIPVDGWKFGLISYPVSDVQLPSTVSSLHAEGKLGAFIIGGAIDRRQRRRKFSWEKIELACLLDRDHPHIPGDKWRKKKILRAMTAFTTFCGTKLYNSLNLAQIYSNIARFP